MNAYPRRSLAFAAALASVALVPVTASAHNISGTIHVDCGTHKVSVAVTNWSGNVEIKNLSTGHLTERAPAESDSTVVFTTAEIGGNGDYTAGRQGHPTDPTPAHFTVHCVVPSPSPTPKASPTPTPTPHATPTPSPTPTGSTSPVSTTSPPPGGAVQSVLAASTTPGLPAAGTAPESPNGVFMVALAVALVAVLGTLGTVRLVRARR